MKIEHFMLIFATIMISGLLMIHYSTTMATTANDLSLRYRECVDTAMEGAVDAVLEHYTDSRDQDGNIWTEQSMKLASDTFYNTLELDFGYPIGLGQDELSFHVPVIMYVDNDGFLFHYIDGTEDERGVRTFKKKFSEKYYWEITDEYDNTIRLTMSDMIYVTRADKSEYKGNYRDIYNEFQQIYQTGQPEWLTACSGQESFYSYKSLLITEKMENNLNYYINLADNTHNTTGKSYYIHLDYQNDTTRQMIEHPGMAAFFQGPVVSMSGKYINVYTIACRTMDTSFPIPVTIRDDGTCLEYHDPRKCSIAKEDIIMYFDTIEEAAKHGVSPCYEW